MNASEPVKLKYQRLLSYVPQLASENGVKLDFSEKSLEDVDTLLGLMHKAFDKTEDKTQETLESFHGFALILGAYVIEVIEKRYGSGEWQEMKSLSALSLPYDLPYTNHGVTITPIAWCYAQIVAPQNGNIVSTNYQSFLKAANG